MSAVFVVAIVLAAVSLALVRLIAALQRAYDECAGAGSTVRAHAPWLRSMRGERPLYPGEKARLTGPERILILVAVLGVAAFEVWFFFFSGSPIDQRSGRGALPAQVAGRAEIPRSDRASAGLVAAEPGPSAASARRRPPLPAG